MTPFERHLNDVFNLNLSKPNPLLNPPPRQTCQEKESVLDPNLGQIVRLDAADLKSGCKEVKLTNETVLAEAEEWSRNFAGGSRDRKSVV